MCLGAIRSISVNQISDLNGHGRVRAVARSFGSLTSWMVTEPQGVLLSDNLEARKRDLYVGGLIALKPHLAGRQSSVTDTGVEIDSGHI